MNNLQMLKRAMLAYVSAVKFIWSAIAYPLSIVGKKFMNLRGYKIYGNSYQSPVGGKNMFYQKGTIQTISGVTVTYDGETQEFTLNGTSTQSHNIIFSTLPIRFKRDTSYTLSITNTSGTAVVGDGTGITYAYTIMTSDSSMYRRTSTELTEFPQVSQLTFRNSFVGWTGNYQIMLQSWRIGTVFDNYKIKIQIEEGATNTEWESYNSAPSPEYPSEIECVGDLSTKNLFDTQGWYSWLRTFTTTYVQKQVVDGISCIYYRPSSTFNKEYMKGQFKVNTRYTISFRAKGIIGTDYSTGFRFMYTDGTSTSVSVSNDDTWNEYTLTSISGKTIDNIQMFLNYPQGCYFDENSIQLEEGTTATDYEPYHKYKIPVVARGKNLFDGSSSEGEGQYLKANGVLGSGSDNLRVTDYITIPSGVSSLTFSYKGDVMNYPSICLYDDSKNYITGKSYGGIRNTNISVPSNAKYVRCSYRTVNTDIQLEGSSTKTGYEPYIAPVTTNIFLDEPLRKVGDYADYIDYEKQKVVRNVYQYNLSEISALGSFNDKTTYWYGYWLIREPYPISINKLKIISDKFKCIYPRNADVEDTYLSNDTPPYNHAMYYSVEKKYCPEVETRAELLDWLKGTNADLFYILATPTEEIVKLPALPQFKGTTIYEVGTNIKPSGMEVKYC